MDQDVHVGDPVRQERIADVENTPGDVRHVSALIVDGHDTAEIRRRGDFREERSAETGGGACDGDYGRTKAFRGWHEVLTLH
ncbi:hypothetical protein Misp02_18900 [Microtetraspora sp. NBRC 16547]|nr:hypothetical protein Misp02_18900 [Microtetraspora sp. NBRC 16547]